MLRDVSKALAYAHQRGVVHRDIKPDNVLLVRRHRGGDGLRHRQGHQRGAQPGVGATLTQIGTSIGTPAYMAPEQAAGDPDIDHRADIYSLGAMAYELLSGQAVFAIADAAAHARRAHGRGAKADHRLPSRAAGGARGARDGAVWRRIRTTGRSRRRTSRASLESITSGERHASRCRPCLLGGPNMFRQGAGSLRRRVCHVAIRREGCHCRHRTSRLGVSGLADRHGDLVCPSCSGRATCSASHGARSR